MGEIIRNVDQDRLPTADQPYDIPTSFASPTLAGDGNGHWHGSFNSNGNGNGNGGSRMHDRAVYSIWSFFTEFCQQQQYASQYPPLGNESGTGGGHPQNKGKTDSAVEPKLQVCDQATNKHLGTPRLPIFVYLAHHASQAEARHKQQVQALRTITANVIHGQSQVPVQAKASPTSVADSALFLRQNSEAWDCAHQTGTSWLERNAGDLLNHETGGRGSAQSPVAAVDQLLHSLGLGDSHSAAAAPATPERLSPTMWRMRNAAWSQQDAFQTPPPRGLARTETGADTDAGGSESPVRSRATLAWCSGVHMPRGMAK